MQNIMNDILWKFISIIIRFNVFNKFYKIELIYRITYICNINFDEFNYIFLFKLIARFAK
jgi:hypothetical protein